MHLLLSPFTSLLLSSTLSASFVLSLYIWRHSLSTDRDHPSVIKQRIISTVTVCCGATIMVWWGSNSSDVASSSSSSNPSLPFLTILGLPILTTSFTSQLLSLLLPLLLTMSLFLGPLVLIALNAMKERDWEVQRQAMNKAKEKEKTGSATTAASSSSTSTSSPSLPTTLLTYISTQFHLAFLSSSIERWKSLRNLIAAPIAEEYLFRSILIYILLSGGYTHTQCILLSPILFGLAHLHHLVGLIRTRGVPFLQGAIIVLIQLAYTTVFGMYVSLVYTTTGSLLSVILIHMFCNMMGFPSLSWWSTTYHPLYEKRIYIMSVFIVGIVIFSLSIVPLTKNELYAEGGMTWTKVYYEWRQQQHV